MMKKIVAMLLLAALLLCGCGKQEAKSGEDGTETTLTGTVVSVEGTKVSLVTKENGKMPSFGGKNGERPTLPEGETMPEGGRMPQMPEGATVPEGFEGFNGGEMPQWTMPENGEMPQWTMPEGERPTRPEGEGGNRWGNMEGMETTEVDLADAHISVETDGERAAGTMEDIRVGSRLTITMVDGKATRVVVTQSSFGGMDFGGGNRPDFGGDPGQRPGNRESQESN